MAKADRAFVGGRGLVKCIGIGGQWLLGSHS